MPAVPVTAEPVPPLEQHLIRWRQHLAQGRRLSPHTVTGYLRDVRQAAAALPAQRLDDFAVQGVEDWIAGYPCAATAQRKLCALRAFLRWCVRRGWIPCCVADDVPLPQLEERIAPRLALSEAEQLVNAPRTTERRASADRAFLQRRDVALMEVLTFCPRASEVAGLEAAGVEIARGGAVLHLHGKGRKDRLIPVGRPAAEALAAYLDARRLHLVQYSAQLGEGAGAALWLSSVRGGKGLVTPLGRAAVRRVVLYYAGRLGLHAYPHKLRHTWATHQLRAGVDLAALQRQLGHASPTVTARYAQADLAFLEAALPLHPRQIPRLELPEDW